MGNIKFIEKELEFILESMECYWDVWYINHEDNLNKKKLYESIKEKINEVEKK